MSTWENLNMTGTVDTRILKKILFNDYVNFHKNGYLVIDIRLDTRDGDLTKDETKRLRALLDSPNGQEPPMPT